jgi:hypothetical protein
MALTLKQEGADTGTVDVLMKKALKLLYVAKYSTAGHALKN